MRWPARTIWDTRIQGICGIVSARDKGETVIFFSATFAQATLSPPRIIINPNRTYSIEGAMERGGRFTISVMPLSKVANILRLNGMRRRQMNKAEIAGFVLREDHEIPYVDGATEILFCEVESTIDSGDRKIYIAKVMETRRHVSTNADRPLLFADVSRGSSWFVAFRKAVRTVLAVSGILDLLRRLLYKFKPPPGPDISRNTYEEAGATDEEITEINRYGLLDRNRHLQPPRAPALVRKQIGVCVLGTSWGSFHCNLIRRANPAARLFVCGRDPRKTAHLAKAFRAEGYFLELEQAIGDPRVQALTVALPHGMHRPITEMIAAAGKHALVEKPIATNLADADAMIKAAKEAGTILMIAEDMHFRPAIYEACNQIIAGRLGEPLHFLSHAATIRDSKGVNGGVLMDIGVHYVRALRLLMGEPDFVMASRAMQINTKISGEDNVQLVFSSNAGWQAHMLFSWASLRGNLPDIIVAGEKGTLHLWPGASYIDLYPAEPTLMNQALSFVRPYSLQEKLRYPRFGRVRIRLRQREGSGYLDEMKEFLAAVMEKRSPVSPPEDARRDLEIVLGSYDALHSGERVAIRALP